MPLLDPVEDNESSTCPRSDCRYSLQKQWPHSESRTNDLPGNGSEGAPIAPARIVATSHFMNGTVGKVRGGRVRRKLVSVLLSAARGIWRCLPASIRSRSIGGAYARYLNGLVCRYADRRSYVATFFLRNRPELQLLRQLAEMEPYGATLNLCVLGCSKGAEVYSMAWTIRSARPDLQLKIHAVDIFPEIVEFAAEGVYSLDSSTLFDLPVSQQAPPPDDIDTGTARDQNASIFEPMTLGEVHSMFEIENRHACVRSWVKENITWLCADACSPSLSQSIDSQDIVVANCFLCHMQPGAAYRCLRNIASFVQPGGHLFVSGVDLDVKSKVASENGWIPVTELLREIHEGDKSILQGWPLEYWGLEPFDDSRPDWPIRYASVFRIPTNTAGPAVQTELEHSAS